MCAAKSAGFTWGRCRVSPFILKSPQKFILARYTLLGIALLAKGGLWSTGSISERLGSLCDHSGCLTSRCEVIAAEKNETSGLDHRKKLSLARLLMPFFSPKSWCDIRRGALIF